MGLFLPTSTLSRPNHPALNGGHWAYRHLEFAFNGNAAGAGVQNLVGRYGESFTQSGSAPIVGSLDGVGIRSAGASEAWTATAKDPRALSRDITLLWRGVVLGAPGGTNTGIFFGLDYGTGGSSPFTIALIARTNIDANAVVLMTNDGVSFTSSNTSVGLSSLYNIPLSIAVSNRAGSAAITVVVTSEFGVHFAGAGTNLAAASGNPRLVSGTDRLQIGCAYGAGRFTNSITTAAAAYSQAFNAQQMLDLCRNHAAIFAPRRALFLSSAVAGGEATGGGSSGYIPFKGPFGHPFNIRL